MGVGESLEVDGGAERFRDLTGGGVGFVSPAGRVRGRRRAAPSAFVVAAAGLLMAAGRALCFVVRLRAAGRALRADTKRRGAPFTKARVTRDAKASGPVVETRKRFAPRSNSQLAVVKDAGLRISRIRADLSWVI